MDQPSASDSESKSSTQRSSHRPKLSQFFQITPTEVREISLIVKRLVLSPATEWERLNHEQIETEKLLFTYFLPLLVLSKISVFFGWTFAGTPVFLGLIHLVVQIALSFVFVLLGSSILQFLAPKFEGNGNFNDSLKLLTFTSLPALAAQLICFIPFIGFLGLIFGLYSFYVYLHGLVPMLSIPRPRRTGFFFVSLIFLGVACGAVSYIVFMGTPPLY